SRDPGPGADARARRGYAADGWLAGVARAHEGDRGVSAIDGARPFRPRGEAMINHLAPALVPRQEQAPQITPRMLQAFAVLQYDQLELVQEARRQLVDNPVLEDADEEGRAAPSSAAGGREEPRAPSET